MATEKWDPPTRTRWTATDGEEMLGAIEASGLSDAAFSCEHGVARHRIEYWRKRLGGTRPRGFVEVQVAQAVEAERRAARVEVALGGGRRLVFHGAWDSGSLVPWLDALEGRS